jgi:hypothetical protein
LHACFNCFYRGLYFHEFIRNLLWVRLRDKGLFIHLSLRNYFYYFERFCAGTILNLFYQQCHASYLFEPPRSSMFESPLNLDTKRDFGSLCLYDFLLFIQSIEKNGKRSLCVFFGRRECVGHSFAHFVFLEMSGFEPRELPQ